MSVKYFYDVYNATYHSGSSGYYWDRYNTNTNHYYEETPFIHSSEGNGTTVSGYESYMFNSSNGTFSNAGAYSSTTGNGAIRYSAGGGSLTRYQKSSSPGYDYIYVYMKGSTPRTSYTMGSFVGTITGSYDSYVNGQRNSDGYWYVRGSSYSNPGYYSRGSFRETIIADDGAYPRDGRQGSYWYVRRDIAREEVGVEKLSTPSGVIEIPLFKVSGYEEQASELRKEIVSGTAYYELVDVGSTRASPLRISTSDGIKAIEKKG